MQLTDLLPIEKWEELENEMNRRSGLDASVFNVDGIRITDNKKWANQFCPVIKANDKGQSFICAVAHQNIATQAMQTRKPVIEECDAGLMKVVAPIFVGDEFLGVAGGCGYIMDDGEMESFLVNKITGIEEEELEKLAESVNRIDRSDVEALAEFIEQEIKKIVSNYKNGSNAR
jgi:ligand-binding sensor protein